MQVKGVPVQVERVPCIPHGAKVLIDKPDNDEECVVWVRDDLDDQTAAILIARGLTASPSTPGLLYLSPHAS